MDRLYVQYGCGLSCPDGWINFDSSPRMRFESLPVVGTLAGALGKRLFPPQVKYGDIVKGLPIADGSADHIYASHVLEHLSRADVIRALANTFRVLKPGGVFRLIVPDLEWRAREYVKAAERGDIGAGDAFVKALHLGRAARPRGTMGVLRSLAGNSSHLWMYDVRSMTKLLEEAGFVDIRRCKFADAGDPMLARVEDPGRFSIDLKHDYGTQHEVALQATKPGQTVQVASQAVAAEG